MRQHNISSAMLQTGRYLKRKLQRGTRQIKDKQQRRQKTAGKGSRCMDNSHVTEAKKKKKNWWIKNSHIDCQNLETFREKQKVQ